MKFLAVVVMLQVLLLASAQESINPHQGINVGMHVGLALAISFGILASCAIGVNIIHFNCKCAKQP
jgi:hypothetical protein